MIRGIPPRKIQFIHFKRIKSLDPKVCHRDKTVKQPNMGNPDQSSSPASYLRRISSSKWFPKSFSGTLSFLSILPLMAFGLDMIVPHKYPDGRQRSWGG